jgi:hypothetical protein
MIFLEPEMYNTGQHITTVQSFNARLHATDDSLILCSWKLKRHPHSAIWEIWDHYQEQLIDLTPDGDRLLSLLEVHEVMAGSKKIELIHQNLIDFAIPGCEYTVPYFYADVEKYCKHLNLRRYKDEDEEKSPVDLLQLMNDICQG